MGKKKIVDESVEEISGSMRWHVKRHYTWLRERNYSEWTISGKMHVMDKFFAWCDERGLIYPEEVTRPTLERYQSHVYRVRSQKTGEVISFSSQSQRLMAVTRFFKWLAQRGFLAVNPAAELELPRKMYRLPRYVLTYQDVEKIMAAVDVSTPYGVRDRAILELLYSTGMRRLEVSSLTLYDVDLERGVVLIRQGKGKQDRYVPMGERAAAWLRKYIDEVRPQYVRGKDEDIIFLGHRSGGIGKGLRYDSIGQLVSRHVENSGIGKKGSCHMFRHAVATELLERGADVRILQVLLGHRSINATEIYTHVSIKKLKDVHTALHPTAKLERETKE